MTEPRGLLPPLPGWPPHVHQMDIDSMSRLGLDADGNIYWDGKRIRYAERLELSWWINAAVIAGALGGLLAGLAAILPFLGLDP